MNHLTKAFMALDHVRSRIGLNTSDNKRFRLPDPFQQGLTEQERERRTRLRLAHNQKAQDLGGFRTQTQGTTRSKTLVGAVGYGSQVLTRGLGNCLEVSCAVAWYLNEQGRFWYDLVVYEGADHVFVAIGQPGGPNGRYPDSFLNWHQDAAICDVWADIACLARDYPDRWRKRMVNWRIMNIELPTGGVFRSPMHANWYDIVDKPKVSYLTSLA